MDQVSGYGDLAIVLGSLILQSFLFMVPPLLLALVALWFFRRRR